MFQSKDMEFRTDALLARVKILEERLNGIEEIDSSVQRKKKLVRLEQALESRNKKIEQLKNQIEMLEESLSGRQTLSYELHNALIQVRRVSEENTRLKKSNDFLLSELSLYKTKNHTGDALRYFVETKNNVT